MNSTNRNLHFRLRNAYPWLSHVLGFLACFLAANLACAQAVPLQAASELASSETVGARNALKVTEPEVWNAHGQLTVVTQKHGTFSSPYAGPNSLQPNEGAKETVDGTLFLGDRKSVV